MSDGFEPGFVGGGFDLSGLGLGPGTAGDGAPGADARGDAAADTLERNLAFLAHRDPQVASSIRSASGVGVELETGEDGGLTGRALAMGQWRSLASRRRAIEEGRRFAETVDLGEAAVVVVRGFGTGHHVRALAERIRGAGSIVVFEPNLAVLRAVLEREDFTGVFASGDVRVVTQADNEAMASRALAGIEALVSMGLKIVDHPASRARLGVLGEDFGVTLARVVSAIKTNVVTTLMQSAVTIRNELMNLDHYAARGGIAPLRGAAAGRAGVVVSAGPGFRRNAHLLAAPGVRDRVVIVAAQTVLKPLLDMGVRPHFVTALDYHEISSRFYEGLTAGDVEGVTLVAEAKANPAIFESFPGRIACPADAFLDELLGQDLLRELGGGDRPDDGHGRLPAGATVAHLAYYLARYLGCDPVALVGQDLAFTDGQYYSAGASIHRVWAAELNEFNTLEMMEWQRIARMGSMLHERADVFGRKVYTDEQMATYLLQFERDFERDAAAGLTVVDATEGGVSKRGTRAMTLGAFLDRAMDAGVLELPEVGAAPHRKAALRACVRRVREVRAGVFKVGKLSRETARVLEQAGDDVASINDAAERAHRNRDEVRKLDPAFRLVQRLNQTGSLKRAKADRAIFLEHGRAADDPRAEQRARLARDVTNLEWLGDASDELGALLDQAVGALQGKGKVRRGALASVEKERSRTREAIDAWAVVVVDPDQDVFGLGRDLGRVVFGGMNALELTLERLGRCRSLAGVVLACEDPARVRSLVGGRERFGRVAVRAVRAGVTDRSAAVRGARGLSKRSWRGGLGSWTVWDEVLDPVAIDGALRGAGVDASASATVVVGGDWALVDPGVTDELVERCREDAKKNRLVFSQAAAGLSPCVLGPGLVNDLVRLRTGGADGEGAGPWCSIGALVGYLPTSPAVDPVAKDGCVIVPPVVRDALERFVCDGGRGAGFVADVLDRVGLDASIEEVARAGVVVGQASAGADEIEALIVGRGDELSAGRLAEVVREAGAGAGVTLVGEPDVLAHSDLASLVDAARGAGAGCVHLRTALVACGDGDDGLAERLLAAGADVVSCDLFAKHEATYRAITGRDDFGATRESLAALVQGRTKRSGVGVPWVVPRIVRRDAVYEEIESFFAESLLATGACVIDPLPEAIDGERIEPLPVPGFAAARRARGVVIVGPDGMVSGAGASGVGGAGRARSVAGGVEGAAA